VRTVPVRTVSEPWGEITCSWCGDYPAIGEDTFSSAPTCGRCAMLRIVRPWGWRANRTKPDLAPDPVGGPEQK
jgi:hypothetical protein